MSADESIPDDVLRALEALERATSPTELGPPYRTLLEWRRRSARRFNMLIVERFAPIGLRIISLTLLLCLAVYFARDFLRDFDLAPIWRDVGLALHFIFVVLLVKDLLVRHWAGRSEREPLTLEERIQSALDRWMHLVPAMRELPD